MKRKKVECGKSNGAGFVLFCLAVIGIIWKLLLKVKRIYGLSGNEMPLELKIITRLCPFAVADIVVKPMCQREMGHVGFA